MEENREAINAMIRNQWATLERLTTDPWLLCSVGEAAAMTGVNPVTIRRASRDERFRPLFEPAWVRLRPSGVIREIAFWTHRMIIFAHIYRRLSSGVDQISGYHLAVYPIRDEITRALGPTPPDELLSAVPHYLGVLREARRREMDTPQAAGGEPAEDLT